MWGRETDYGAERQRHNVIRSLATQAYLGRRKDMFRDELLIAVKLVQSGTIRMDICAGNGLVVEAWRVGLEIGWARARSLPEDARRTKEDRTLG